MSSLGNLTKLNSYKIENGLYSSFEIHWDETRLYIKIKTLILTRTNIIERVNLRSAQLVKRWGRQYLYVNFVSQEGQLITFPIIAEPYNTEVVRLLKDIRGIVSFINTSINQDISQADSGSLIIPLAATFNIWIRKNCVNRFGLIFVWCLVFFPVAIYIVRSNAYKLTISDEGMTVHKVKKRYFPWNSIVQVIWKSVEVIVRYEDVIPLTKTYWIDFQVETLDGKIIRFRTASVDAPEIIKWLEKKKKAVAG